MPSQNLGSTKNPETAVTQVSTGKVHPITNS
jgi:hypothetical protein